MRVWPFDGRTNKKNAYVQSFMFSTLPPIRTQLAKNIQLRVWTRWFNTPTNLVGAYVQRGFANRSVEGSNSLFIMNSS